MAKSSSRTATRRHSLRGGVSEAEFLAAFASAAARFNARANASAKTARDTLVSEGILTTSGALAKPYRRG